MLRNNETRIGIQPDIVHGIEVLDERALCDRRRELRKWDFRCSGT